MKKLQPFGYYGGKFYHIEKLYRLFPRHKCFVDVFGGSGVVVLNKEPAIDIYNDIDGNVVNFFRVLREKPEELIRLLELTPYSREEYYFCYKTFKDKDLPNVERARRFFSTIHQAFSSIVKMDGPVGWKGDPDRNRAVTFSNNSKVLLAIAQRLKEIQIENNSFEKVIEKYDTENTFFYCDPPYVADTRRTDNCYQNEMTDEQHRDLSNILHGIKGKFLLSGYGGTLYQDLYPDVNYREFNCLAVANGASKDKSRTESLWFNYEIEDIFTLAARQEALL